jgi:hypothetical protein
MCQKCVRLADSSSDQLLLAKQYLFKNRTKGAVHNMHTFIVVLVMVAFLAAIFTAGYNDKPGTNK